MTFALATLAFLVAGWLTIVVIAGTLEDYGAKMLAALGGRQSAEPVPAVTIRLRQRYPTARPVKMRAQAQLRAAA